MQLINTLLENLPVIHTLRLAGVNLIAPSPDIKGQAAAWEGVLSILSLFQFIGNFTFSTPLARFYEAAATWDASNQSLIAKYLPQLVVVQTFSLQSAPIIIPKLIAPAAVKTLAMECDSSVFGTSMVDLFASLIQDSSSTLKHLECHILRSFVYSDSNYRSLLQHRLNLSACSRLQSIHLSLETGHTDDYNYDSYLAIPLALFDILPLSVQTIAFHIMASSNLEILLTDHFDFERMESALLRLPELRTITFDISTSVVKPISAQRRSQLAGFFKTKMPVAASRDLLRFGLVKDCRYLYRIRPSMIHG
ncbi:hypothetical protein ABKN59_010641 [Abortiporus biennis]